MRSDFQSVSTQQLQKHQALVGLSEKSLVIDHLKDMVTNKANLNPLELADRIEGEGKEGFLLGLMPIRLLRLGLVLVLVQLDYLEVTITSSYSQKSWISL